MSRGVLYRVDCVIVVKCSNNIKGQCQCKYIIYRMCHKKGIWNTKEVFCRLLKRLRGVESDIIR